MSVMETPVFNAPETLEEAQHQLDTLWAYIGENQHKMQQMEERLRWFIHRCFGSSSEKANAAQLQLFNEAEQSVGDTEAEDADAEIDESPETETLTYTRKKPGRPAIPDNLPRIRIEHELAEAERFCACGCERHVMGEEISEQLDIIPAQVQVLQHVRKKYACRQCEGSIKTAPLPPQPLPKTKASPGLLAFIIAAKFVDALPLYRQSTILQRHGIQLPRQTLSNWVIGCGRLIQPLINLLQDHVLSGRVLQVDETTVQVLQEDGRDPQTKSYMWVRVGGTAQQRAVLFHYAPSRGGQVARELLDGFQGYLQTDDYAAYDQPGKQAGVTHQACMAHARRKFTDAQKAAKPNKSTKNKAKTKNRPKTGKVEVALGYFAKLYAIEKRIKSLPDDERYQIRQQEAIPLLTTFRQWLDKALGEGVLPKSYLGKALSYLHNNWNALLHYTEAGYLSIDNNAAENAIRPFVIGRKNWLFNNTVAGAEASANLYSLIETAKANGLEPYHYLKRVLTELPAANTVEQIEALLPWQVKMRVPVGVN